MTLLTYWRSRTTAAIGGFVVVAALLAGCSVESGSAPAIATAGVSVSSSVSSAVPAQAATVAPTSVPTIPTAAPTPVATATPALSAPTATAALPQPSPATASGLAAVGSPAPAAGATPSACTTLPVRGFGLVWQDHPEAQGLVGCPTGAEAAIGVVSEPFEHGWMVQLSSPVPGQTAARTVYVLFGDDATVAQVPDTWAATDPIPTGQTPPAGLVAPVRDFGKVWRDGTDMKIRQRLGWAKEPEKGAAGAWQPYQQGLMIWTPEPKQIFVVGQQGPTGGGPNAWRLYPDLFAG